jgi:AmmeMemoRadiSam system protein A
MKRSVLFGVALGLSILGCGRKPEPLPADGRAEAPVHPAAAVPKGTMPQQIAHASSGEADPDRLDESEQQALLDLAKRTVEILVREGRQIDVSAELLSRFPRFRSIRGTFVTLKKRGELRGCIGTLKASQPLGEDVVMNAVNAATRDPRFSPVRPEELADIAVSVSVLDVPRPLVGVTGDALVKKLGAEHPGLIIEYQGRRSTFLPQVWDELPQPTEFLGHLCQKQGSAAGCWREPAARFESYGAQVIGEGKR